MVNGKLHGLISGHVDDFLFSGSDSDQQWTRVVDAIKKSFAGGIGNLINLPNVAS